MSVPFRHGYDAIAREREIRLLSGTSGAPACEVRAPFVPEFARLGMGAKIGAYLTVLTESNVRGMLRRKDAAASRVSAAAVVGR
jgi:hypothetical protein